MQLKTDGPFRTGRKWYSQFYATPEQRAALAGVENVVMMLAGPDLRVVPKLLKGMAEKIMRDAYQAAKRSLTRRSTSRPSIPGILRSSTITSGASVSIRASASSPS